MSRLHIPALLIAATMALTGCGASGSEDKGNDAGSSDTKPKEDLTNLSADELLAKSKKAATEAEVLTISGAGSGLALDISYLENASTGTITLEGAEIKLLTVDGKSWIRGSDDFWKKQAPDQANQIITVINGRWIVADPANADFKDLISFGDRKFVTETLLVPDDEMVLGKPKTIDGVECLALSDGKNGNLYVAKDDGRPIQVAGETNEDMLKFSYDEVDEPKAPAKDEIVDLGALG